MPIKRATPDGLPFNVYERRGLRVYRIWYKDPKPPRAIRFTLTCPANDAMAVRKTRADAKIKAATLSAGAPVSGTFKEFSLAWLKLQQDKPSGSEGRRADTTLAENAREIAKLNEIMGDVSVGELVKTDAYDYLEAGEQAARPAKANKEIALATTILEYAVRKGIISVNPFMGVKKNVTAKHDRRVTDAELELAVEVGRQEGGARLIVALALKTAWLCVRRSVEVRDLQRPQIREDGIHWTGAKRKRGTHERSVIIEWTPALKATIDEVLAVERYKTAAGAWFVFGSMHGQKYTKGGWNKMLWDLMARCAVVAAERDVPFQRFSLQDCRPKGVSDKLAQGDVDTQDATLHTNKKMIDNVYDRRTTRTAKPVR